ncbi:MAG TPA: phosphate ABC transporter, permease protein PstA, partial [Gammaproteobacteria bacterium]|nr:phosphate ABC transporter, permease protein PstA [Gammaproteobacteria bacterium]
MHDIRTWFKSGTPWIWLNAAAVSMSLIMVFGLLILIAVRGLGYFWPADIVETWYTDGEGNRSRLIGEIWETETVSAAQLAENNVTLPEGLEHVTRYLIKVGNRDLYGADFKVAIAVGLEEFTWPEELVRIERREWGNFYGRLLVVKEQGRVVAEGDEAWAALQPRLERAVALYDRIEE